MRSRSIGTGKLSLLSGTVLAGLSAVVLPQQAFGQAVWEGTVSTSWFTAGNWNFDLIPGANEDVFIDTITPNPVTIGAPGAVGRILEIGRNATGRLTVTGTGTLAVETANLGLFAGGNGTLLLDGPNATVDISEILNVGELGAATLRILSGAKMTVGQQAGVGTDIAGGASTALVSGAGSSLVSDGFLIAGAFGDGTLRVEAGGRAEGAAVQVASGPGSAGLLVVSGQGSTVVSTGEASQAASIGNQGEGTLIVEQGATFTTVGAASIGSFEGGKGLATVTGEGSTWDNSNAVYFYVGAEADGSLNVLDGATVVNGGETILGLRQGAAGRVLVSGEDSFWNNGDTIVVGQLGSGSVEVAAGAGLVTAGATIGLAEGSTGAVKVSGEGSAWLNQGTMAVGLRGSGRLDIEAGGIAGTGQTGVGVNTTGIASITGPGSAWAVAGGLTIGETTDGDGTLNISDGARVQSQDGFVARLSVNTVGNVTVAGPGSSWLAGDEEADTGGFVVGGSGTATFVVADGARVEAVKDFRMALFDSSTARVTVTGAGTVLRAGQFVDGSSGAVTMLVSDGARVEAGRSVFVEGGRGMTMTVRGATLHAEDFLFVGSFDDSGTLIVEQGGLVESTGALLGFIGGTATGSVRVAGQGSSWIDDGTQFLVGNNSNGSLTIADGGLVRLTSGLRRVEIGVEDEAAGALNIGAAPGAAAVAPGILDAAEVVFGRGAGSLNFNHTGRNYVFAPVIDGGGALNVLSGTTVMTADSRPFFGPTSISGGALIVNGLLSRSTVNVTGGTLGGNGTVGATTIANGGTLAPGASIGTLNIAGNLAITAGGVYAVEVSPTAADRTDVTGTVSLGGTLNAIALGGSYAAGTYTILSSTGAITGTFADFVTTGSFSALTASVAYTGNSVILNLAGVPTGPAVWNGSQSTDWYTAANWESEAVPTLADEVTMNTVTPNATIINGGAASSAGINIGTAAGTTGDLTVNGGGRLNTGGQAIVGSAGGTGTATVAGAGSQWTVAGTLFVGQGIATPRGAGSVSVRDGATLNTASAVVAQGSTPGSHASIEIVGPGSTWNNAGTLLASAPLTEALLTIAGGAKASTGDSSVAGHLLVTGAGSTWTTGKLQIGNVDPGSGTLPGFLEIVNGSVVDSASAIVSAGISLVGSSVAVDGAGSRWNVAGALALGTNEITIARLRLSNGGVVSAGGGTGTVLLGTNPAAESFATLEIGGDAAAAPGTLEAANVRTGRNGSVWFRHNATNYDFAPGITGAGTVVAFAGTTRLASVNTYSGGTTIEGGTLIGSASSFGSGAIVNNATLVLDQAEDGALANAISGDGALVKRGTGALNLAGTGTLSGPTTVQSGILRVNGSLRDSAVAVSSGGTLGGAGTVGATTVASGGTLAPGNSIGTLNVAGNVTFAAGSTYAVEVDAAGQSDRIAAAGKATLSGGTVSVLAANGAYRPTTGYTILTAQGGIDGTFANVTSNLAFLEPTLGYGANAVTLTLTRNAADFCSVGDTFNQCSTGDAVEALGAGNGIFDAVVKLDAAGARTAFDQLSGEIHASVGTMLLEDSRFPREAAIRRLGDALGTAAAAAAPVIAYGPDGATAAPADTERLAVWADAYGSWGQVDGDGNAARLNRTLGGLLIGVDMPVAEAVRIGVLGGYGRTSFDVDGRGSDGDADSYHLGLYGGGTLGSLRLTGGGAYSWHAIDTSRSVDFTGFSDTLSADYGAHTVQAFGEAAYSIDMRSVTLEPFAGIAFVRVSTDGFTEGGGAAALSAAPSDADATFGTVGLRASAPLHLAGRNAAVSGMVGWRHAFEDDLPASSFAFAGGGPFPVLGLPLAEDVAVVEAEFEFKLSPRATLGLSYSGQFGSELSDHGGRARIAIDF